MTLLVIVVMGVSGSGKTTIAERLALRLGWEFKEGDELHPAANVEKMRQGKPLSDEDRAPWLTAVAEWIEAQIHAGANGIITCSGLKRRYRDTILNDRPEARLVYLHGDRSTLQRHLDSRRHAFMPATLLGSQLDTLEIPSPEENGVTVDVGGTVEQTIDQIVHALAL